MNQGHARLCSSERWAAFIAEEVLPAALAGQDLGGALLEVGPGYGAATAVLATQGRELTAVEIDDALAARLEERFPAVRVVRGRGEDLPFPAHTFTAVLSFTMLHHMHSPAAQDALFAEAARVLRPGGVLVGSDSIASAGLRAFHSEDVYTPVDPGGLAERLTSAGFGEVTVTTVPHDEWFWFAARPA